MSLPFLYLGFLSKKCDLSIVEINRSPLGRNYVNYADAFISVSLLFNFFVSWVQWKELTWISIAVVF